MSTFEILGGDSLDFESYADLQKRAYAELLKKSKVSGAFMIPKYFKWKYHTPAGKAKIAVVRDGARYIAANAMIPIEIRYKDTKIRGWQSCDTATAPEARGKGYFQGCLHTLESALGQNEIFFGFPNQNSIGGFLKLGWIDMGVVTTWLNPIAFLGWRPSGAIEEVTRFGDSQDTFSERLVGLGKSVMLDKGASYLNWRYIENPVYKYTCFQYKKGEDQLGFAVVKTAEVLERQVGVVMDLWGHDSKVERHLLRHVSWWAKGQKRRMVVLLDTGLSISTGVLSSFIPVWSNLLPKKQVLMGKAAAGDKASVAMQSKWRVQMGDWDAF